MSDVVTEALEWAWTNMKGHLPDRNTMSEAEIEKYWQDYENILECALRIRTGRNPSRPTNENENEKADTIGAAKE